MTPQDSTYHMTSAEFRKFGREIIDWIADYYEEVESYPVMSQVNPGDIRANLPEKAPVRGESFDTILADFERIIMPGITHWQSPNFYAYFPANTSPPSVLGELLSAGLGVQGMLWATSPACTELETLVLDWLVDILGLPPKFKSQSTGGGVIQDTASSSSLSALLVAREKSTDFHSNEAGCDGRLVAYASTQTHSSIEKAVKISGLGRQNLHLIDVDDGYAMRPAELQKKINEDRQSGLVPSFVCATIGTTASNAIDPLPEIGKIARQEGLWLHVDGAMSGTAAICPEYRFIQEGLEYADSYCFNPHKWMFTNFDCDCFFVADRSSLIKTLSILPEYLKNKATETGAVIDYRDWHIQLGRRFRALKLWFVIRHYGVEGLEFHVRNHISLAQKFARWVEEDPDFELTAPAPLNLICFRHKAGDEINRDLLERLNQGGRLYLSHAVLDGRYTLRLCVGQTHTEARHVEEAWRLIRKTANELSLV
jgi:aromatic-L-amino-acid/L-tryptophan decarboxylase